jgi:hypothetical protein
MRTSEPDATGRPEMLASGLGAAERVVVDETHVYWASGRTLSSVSKVGGEVRTVMTAPPDQSVILGDVVGGRLFWVVAPPVPPAEDTSPEMGVLGPRDVEVWASSPLASSGAAQGTLLDTFSSRSTEFRFYAGTGSDVYVTTTGEIGVGMYGTSAALQKVGASGAPVLGRPEDDSCVGWSTPYFVFTRLVISGDRLFGVLWDDGDPGMCPLLTVTVADYCRQPAVRVEPERVDDFVVDRGEVFAFHKDACSSQEPPACEERPAQLVVIDTTASPSTRRVIAAGRTGHDLAVDARSVYWLEDATGVGGHPGPRGTGLFRMARTGVGAVETLVEAPEGGLHYALDSESIFWLAGGTLHKRRK